MISRAAKILRALRDHPKGLSLSKIAKEVGLARSTVQRIVTALEQ
ncbi:MAG: helix-turn-helix domain-containing protein, partial [Bacillus sp. (in: firmicutes)]